MSFNTSLRVLAALAFVLAATSPSSAATETDITGAWIVTLDFVSSKATIEANIKQSGEKLVAAVNTPAGHLDFSGTLVNNKISAVYTLQLQGNSLEIRMSGVVDADTLSGTLEFGPGQHVKWTAVRKPVVDGSETPESGAAHERTPEVGVEVPK